MQIIKLLESCQCNVNHKRASFHVENDEMFTVDAKNVDIFNENFVNTEKEITSNDNQAVLTEAHGIGDPFDKQLKNTNITLA